MNWFKRFLESWLLSWVIKLLQRKKQQLDSPAPEKATEEKPLLPPRMQ